MKAMKPASVLGAWCLTAICAVSPSADGVAQSYPVKPLRIVEGFGAGSASDAAARVLAQKLGDQLKQLVIVENRLGAGGLIAADTVAKSPSDGYTLLLMSAGHGIHPAIVAKMPYAMPRDFAPISLVATGHFLLVVHPVVPAGTVKDLIALARAKPGELNFASSGIGSPGHLSSELFNTMAKIKVMHVPYKGSPSALLGVINGEADMAILSITAIRPLLEAGKVRALAVMSAKRTALMPSMPTLHESGVPGYARTGWYGLLGPVGMPKEILSKLNATIVQLMNLPETKDAYFRQGLEPETSSPDEFTALINHEIEQNIKLARGAGIKLE